MLNLSIPISGVLQELGIQRGLPPPMYFDSATTVFVAKDDTAVKKSVWIIRRAKVLQEGVVYGEMVPVHILEKYMVADPFTKYLPFPVWSKHRAYLLNMRETLPAERA